MTTNFDLTTIQDRLDQVSRHYEQYGFTLTFSANEAHPYLRRAIIHSKARPRLHTYYVQDVFNLESHSLYQELAFLEWFASTLQTIDTNLQYFEQVTAYVNLSYRGETGHNCQPCHLVCFRRVVSNKTSLDLQINVRCT